MVIWSSSRSRKHDVMCLVPFPKWVALLVRINSMSKTEYVLDASFIVDHLQGDSRTVSFRKVVAESTCIISAFTHAEVVSKFERSESAGLRADEAVVELCEIQQIGRIRARAAALLHAQMRLKRPKFSLGDAFVLALARERKCTILTTDNDFAGLPEAKVLR